METKTTHLPINLVESLPDLSTSTDKPELSVLDKLPPVEITSAEQALDLFPRTVLGSLLRAVFRDPRKEPWPLNNVGDEEYFGHILAVGVSRNETSGEEDTFSPYMVCEGRGAEPHIYEIPADEELVDKLLKQVEINLHCVLQSDHVGSRVYIQKTESGYSVEKP